MKAVVSRIRRMRISSGQGSKRTSCPIRENGSASLYLQCVGVRGFRLMSFNAFSCLLV